jgi:hypothetical protein
LAGQHGQRNRVATTPAPAADDPSGEPHQAEDEAQGEQ